MAKHSVTEFLDAFRDYRVAAFDLETDLIIGLDKDGNIAVVNPAFEKVLGYREENMLHKPIVHFVSIHDLSKFIRIFYDRDYRTPFDLLHCWSGVVTVRLVAYQFAPMKGVVIFREVAHAPASR